MFTYLSGLRFKTYLTSSTRRQELIHPRFHRPHEKLSRYFEIVRFIIKNLVRFATVRSSRKVRALSLERLAISELYSPARALTLSLTRSQRKFTFCLSINQNTLNYSLVFSFLFGDGVGRGVFPIK